MIDNKNCWLKKRCDCEHCDSFCMKLFKLNYLFDRANMSMSQRTRITLSSDKDGTDKAEMLQLNEFATRAVDFVNSGCNLIIHSKNTGNGKTSWALRIVQEYLERIWEKSSLECRALYVNVPQYLLALKDNISEKNEYAAYVKENIPKADIIIWDDIATKTVTSFEAENLFSAIDLRISNGKANIFTSNLSLDEMKSVLGDRLTSRIRGGYDIELHGADKRKAAFEKKRK